MKEFKILEILLESSDDQIILLMDSILKRISNLIEKKKGEKNINSILR